MIHASALIGPDCRVGENAEIGPFCTVGLDGPEPATVIGAGANLRSMSVIYRAVTAGLRFSTGHGVLVREFTTLGDDVSVGSHCVVEHHVVVESGVRLHSNCFVPEYSVLEQECWLGPGVIVTNSRYPAQPDSKERLAGVRIQRGAVIGAGVVLLPGVVIGPGALVGAGAVVVTDVAPGAVVAGNPARAIRSQRPEPGRQREVN